MKAISIPTPGGPDALVFGDQPDPRPGPSDLLIRVHAAGVNRPDVLQRQGHYDPPPGTSPLPGLEVAGVVVAAGEACTRFAVGARVCALVGGGGYAERCVAPEAQCLPVPDGRSLVEAAAVPETWFTVWANVFEHGGLQGEETLLVHGGSSGVGHAAIKLAKARGARVVTTSSNRAKADFCRSHGADLALDYTEGDFVGRVKTFTEGRGADVILDMVGGDYLSRNLDALAFRGRHVSIAFLRGMVADLPLAKVMAKQAILTGSFLRRRPPEEKARLTKAVETELWPLLASGAAGPHVDRTFPLAEAAEAHRVMDSGAFFAKLVLEM